jgi:hypothetical protein
MGTGHNAGKAIQLDTDDMTYQIYNVWEKYSQLCVEIEVLIFIIGFIVADCTSDDFFAITLRRTTFRASMGIIL